MTDITVVNVGELSLIGREDIIATLSAPMIQAGGGTGEGDADRHTYILRLTILNDAEESVNDRLRLAMRQLDPARGAVTVTVANLIAPERPRFMQFVVRNVNISAEREGTAVVATLDAVIDRHWRSINVVEETFTLTGSDTITLGCEGDLEAYPTYTFTPRAARSAPNWAYRRPVRIMWNSPLGGDHAIDVTGIGINTAALVSGGKVTNRTNIGVYLNGEMVRHWYPPDGESMYDAFNNTTTRLWVNLHFTPLSIQTLRLAVGTDETEWAIQGDGNIPDAGTILIDAEVITYNRRVSGYIYDIKRGRYGTTPADHAVGALLKPYHTVGHILYGPSAAVPENLRDTHYNNDAEPVFMKNGTDNTAWTYSNFADYAKTQAWSYRDKGDGLGYVSESDRNGIYSTAWVYPWTAIGLAAGWTQYSAFSSRFAVPIRLVRVIGRQIARTASASASGSPILSLSSDDGLWRVDAFRSEQTLSIAPTTFDVTSPDLRPTSTDPLAIAGNNLMWFVNQGSYLQVDISQLVVTFDPTYLPTIVVGAEEATYDLDLVLSNETTQESLLVQFPVMTIDKSLIIDSDEQTVIYSDDGSDRYGAVRRNAPRQRFLPLAPGTNQIAITEAGMGTLDVTITYRPRWFA